MSQTSNDSADTSTPQGRIDLLHKMLGTGRSFSGHERNCLYLNTGGAKSADDATSKGKSVPRFANVSATTGFDFPDDARGLALVDWDYDGDLDLWVANRNAPRLRFLRNESNQTGNFVNLRLVGNGTSSNRDAIGARVQVVTDSSSPLVQIKTLRAGDGFISQNSKWMHFGLGAADEIDHVIVTWPAGKKEVFSGLTINKRFTLIQGSGTAQQGDSSPRQLAIKPGQQTPPKQSGPATLRLMVPLEMPPLTYQTASGQKRQVQKMAGKPVLVSLWATWCKPCAKEIRETIELQDEIRAAGLQVLALSVDGLGDDASTPRAAAAHLKSLQYPFASGHATELLLDILQEIHDLQTPINFRLPLPSSFLFDAQGRLMAIYKGPISIDDVLVDLAKKRGNHGVGFQHAAAIPGRVLQHPEAINALKREESVQRSKLAGWFRNHGLNLHATAQYGQIVRLWPNTASARVDFGSALMGLNRIKLAQKQFEKAVAIEPETFGALINLGRIQMRQRNLPAARDYYEKAIALSPDHAMILNNLGSIASTMQEYDKAQDYFRQAIEADPEAPGGHNNLAWLLATCPVESYRDTEKAVASAERACELSNWKDHNTLDTLAAAEAAAGNFNSAARWASQALNLAPDAAKPSIQRHLQLYQAGKPYQEPSDN